MILRRTWVAFLRFAFHLFYNPFAFSYDPVSALVSRGHWRDWTRAAISHIAGTRVLEIPCGTGNLLLDLADAGYQPVGVDLSEAMLRISRGKLRRVGTHGRAPLLRARAQSLPFPSQSFDSIVMTFPPGFVHDLRALAELRRVLDSNGRLIWVDAGRLLPRDRWNQLIQSAVDLIEGAQRFAEVACESLSRAGFEAIVETVRNEESIVMVVVAKPMPSKQ